MVRLENTTALGYGWPEVTIWLVWQKGTPITGWDPAIWRQDVCGKLMKYDSYGDRSSPFGWEVDHIMPVSLGGTDEIGNLQPLQWRVNVHKSNDVFWTCPVQ